MKEIKADFFYEAIIEGAGKGEDESACNTNATIHPGGIGAARGKSAHPRLTTPQEGFVKKGL